MNQRTDSMTNYSRCLISSLTTVQEVLLEDFNVKLEKKDSFKPTTGRCSLQENNNDWCQHSQLCDIKVCQEYNVPTSKHS
jgi:hypothetical protein